MSVLSEFDGCDLDDKRREDRLRLMVAALEVDAEKSLPEAFGYGLPLAAAYRFFNNDDISEDALLAPHIACTVARMRQHKTVFVAHDTTHFQPSATAARKGFGDDGFRSHVSFVVSADGRREPLGLLGIETWAREEAEVTSTPVTTSKKKKTKKKSESTEERRKDDNRESRRWLRRSEAGDALAEGVRLIHVEDREGDIYESLATRLQNKRSFIVRGQSHRKVIVDDGTGEQCLHNIMEHVRGLQHGEPRIVTLSRRAGTKMKSAHPQRDGRDATLVFAGAPVVIREPRVPVKGLSGSLSLNAVHVMERDPPDGEEAIEWLLLTTEPVATPEDIDFVVEGYRTRWMIEEYFKALKTGCAYESRQLESFSALKRALSLFSVIAWRLMWMRFKSREATASPAASVLTASELKVLRAQKRIGPEATAAEALRAIATLGGHLKRNGDPGILVLWRGHRTLRDVVIGYELALAEMS